MKLHLPTLALTFAFLLPNHVYAQSSSKVISANQYGNVSVKQNSKATSNWYKYTAKDGSYTILHPQAPQEEATDVMGIKAVFVVSEDAKGRGYMSNSTKLPLTNIDTSLFDTELLYNYTLDNLTKKSNAVIVSQQNITFNGFPGKEAIIHFKNDKYFAKVRFFLNPKNAMMYQVMIASADNNFNFPEATAFIDSLTIK